MPEPILIAGAGPAGLSAACRLAARGVPVVVLEAEPALPENLRASTFHPPTLDMLAEFGASERLIEMGLKAPRFQFRDRATGRLAEFDFGLIADATRHPFRVQCEQFKLNRVLLDWLRDRPGAEVRFGTRVADVEQDESGVTVLVETAKGGERVAGSHLIGADGAASAVRRALGIELEGFTWPDRFLVVSTPFPFEEHVPDLTLVNYYADPEEWFFLLRVPGLWRVMFPTRPAESEAEIFDPARIERRLQRVLRTPVPYPVRHTTLYRVHQRVATAYRRGRVFLAGDAAHVNNPLGGMGMNGGIHDALSIAGKLARVRAGAAPASLLDAYEPERRPIALDYVNTITIRNKRNLETADPAEQRAFRTFLAEIKSDPAKERDYLMRVSMIASLRGEAAQA